jgi:uncharacterized delta-60 repeat protein
MSLFIFVRRVLIAAITVIATPLYAAPGDLDTTFSSDGKRTLSFYNENSRAAAVMVRPDGRIVVAGTCNLTPSAFCITQMSATGTLDLAFGSQGNGVEIAAINTTGNTATAAAMQPDGKVVVAGHCQDGTRYDFCLARFTVGGRLDSSFGSGGKIATDVTANNDFAYALALQPDGKIVVVGQCGSSTFGNFCVARYHSHGALDNSFSGNGIQATDIVRDDKANAVAIQSDGKIIVAGTCADSTAAGDERFCIARYTSTGVMDTGFPKMPARGGDRSVAKAIVIQPDGRFIVLGQCEIGVSNERACLSRYNTDGSADITFRSAPQTDANFDVAAAALQPDGKIAVAGHKGVLEDTRFVVALFNSDGTLDQSFNADGQAEADFVGTGDFANAMTTQMDGKLVLAGYCNDYAGAINMCVSRIEAPNKGYRECSLDIDGDGKVTATVDSLIHARIALGLTGSAVVGSITFPANASRNSWGEIRTFLVTQCGMNLAP